MQGSVRKKGDTWYYRYYIFVHGVKKQIEKKGGSTKHKALEKLNEEIGIQKDFYDKKNHNSKILSNMEVSKHAREC